MDLPPSHLLSWLSAPSLSTPEQRQSACLASAKIFPLLSDEDAAEFAIVALMALPVTLKDHDLAVRRAVGVLAEPLFRHIPHDGRTEGLISYFLDVLLADVQVGYERKNEVAGSSSSVVGKKAEEAGGANGGWTGAAGGESEKVTNADLAPAHMRTRAQGAPQAFAAGEQANDEFDCDPIPGTGPLEKPSTDSLAPHDTAGWGTLETSMGTLAAMLRGAGARKKEVDATTTSSPVEDHSLPFFSKPELTNLYQLLKKCAEHRNRFVREYAFLGFAELIPLLGSTDPTSGGGTDFFDLYYLLAEPSGLSDNWSQVKFAASKATRSLTQHPAFDRDTALPILVPHMLLNRHYVAEGVRLYSLENWQILNPTGGVPSILACLDQVVEVYCSRTNAPNHAVREAACKCILELGQRVAGTPSNPTPFRNHFFASDGELLEKLAQALLSALTDESWPVRDHAGTACGVFCLAFPEALRAHREKLLDLLVFGIGDNIPSLRKNMAAALAQVVLEPGMEIGVGEIFEEALDVFLAKAENQPMDSGSFVNYTPSGPFSVPSQKQHYVLGEEGER